MTKLNATNGELLDLINGLFAVKDLSGKDFSLPVGKNLNILKEVLDPLEKLGRPSEEFLELASKVQAIADKNEDDSKEQILELEAQYPELVAERKKQVEVMAEKMQEKLEVELYTLSTDILPEAITPQQIMNLEKILE
tara:strand:+ start:103 stop:516 length:414 start_codon:yes stop_codon:yes gene_type:complete